MVCMNTCVDCQKDFKTRQGLQGHRRLKHRQGQPANLPDDESEAGQGQDLTPEQLRAIGAGVKPADDNKAADKAAGAELAARLGLMITAFWAPAPAEVEHVVRERLSRLGGLEAEASKLGGELLQAKAEISALSARHPAGLCQNPACQDCPRARGDVANYAYTETLRLVNLGGGRFIRKNSMDRDL